MGAFTWQSVYPNTIKDASTAVLNWAKFRSLAFLKRAALFSLWLEHETAGWYAAIGLLTTKNFKKTQHPFNVHTINPTIMNHCVQIQYTLKPKKNANVFVRASIAGNVSQSEHELQHLADHPAVPSLKNECHFCIFFSEQSSVSHARRTTETVFLQNVHHGSKIWYCFPDHGCVSGGK